MGLRSATLVAAMALALGAVFGGSSEAATDTQRSGDTPKPQISSPAAVFNTFAPDVPDPELGEMPNVCAHFVISSSGQIFRLVNLRTRCRHTVGLNWTAIGIEHTESLASPYHRERVPSLRRQTHGDWRHSSMQIYQDRLRTLGRC